MKREMGRGGGVKERKKKEPPLIGVICRVGVRGFGLLKKHSSGAAKRVREITGYKGKIRSPLND